MTPRRGLLVAAVAAVVLVLDRLTKALVVGGLELHESREVVGDLVRLTRTENSGSAFGLFQDRTTILAVLSVVAVVAIVYYYRALAARSALLAVTLGMLLGGALGNLVDRVADGRVVDFVDVGIGAVRFWAFNVADSSIVVGILATMGLLWLDERRAAAPPPGA